jgi:hypothetical protein
MIPIRQQGYDIAAIICPQMILRIGMKPFISLINDNTSLFEADDRSLILLPQNETRHIEQAISGL